MAEMTHDERAAGKGFTHLVEELAGQAPDVFCERVLHATAHRLRKRYGYSRELKKTELLRRVQKEPLGLTVMTLKQELGFHIDDVTDLVKELVAEGKVTSRRVHPAGSRGGRPATMVSIPHELFPPKT